MRQPEETGEEGEKDSTNCRFMFDYLSRRSKQLSKGTDSLTTQYFTSFFPDIKVEGMIQCPFRLSSQMLPPRVQT